MGYNAKPGASLKSFKEFFGKAEIYGADIDANIKLDIEKIKTFVVDQRSVKSLNLYHKKLLMLI